MFRKGFAFSVLLSVLSGCGGDDDPSKSSGEKGARDAEAGDAQMDTPPDAATSGVRDAAADSGVRMMDAAGSSEDDCTKVELTYSDFAVPFFSRHCGKCHGAGDKAPPGSRPPPHVTFGSESDLDRLRDRIRKAAVEDKRMPPGAPLSDCLTKQLSDYLDTLSGPQMRNPMNPEPTNPEPTNPEPMKCQPKCDGKQCGDDGCGGTCGTCDSNHICTADRQCACAPACAGKHCGPDGCGGNCGACAPGLTCDAAGSCICVPNCQGKQCGSDGCGGSCGACDGSMVCDTNAGMCQATCTPNCTGKTCGDDGCGGSCGTCANGQTCSAAGSCIAAALDFATDVYPIFAAAGCGNSSCHGGASPAQGMNLSSAANALSALVGVAANECTNRLRVAPGAPDSSYLINKLTGQDMCAGERMPRGGAALPQNQIATIRAWISGL
jgi:hypothetical protein